MTPRQARFVQEYLIDRNGAAAAIRAGYSVRSAKQIAYELLAKPEVAEAVRQGEARVAQEAAITRGRVLAGLREAIELARERQDPGAMIRGWATIGRMAGFYAPETRRVELNAGYVLRAQYEVMTDDELLSLAAQPS